MSNTPRATDSDISNSMYQREGKRPDRAYGQGPHRPGGRRRVRLLHRTRRHPRESGATPGHGQAGSRHSTRAIETGSGAQQCQDLGLTGRQEDVQHEA